MIVEGPCRIHHGLHYGCVDRVSGMHWQFLQQFVARSRRETFHRDALKCERRPFDAGTRGGYSAALFEREIQGHLRGGG
jgi:hypothetical protein